MSARINIMMGYGLTDLQTTDELITDPRINPVGYLGLIDENIQDDVFSIHGFKKQLQLNLKDKKRSVVNLDLDDQFLYLNYCKEKIQISDCIVHDAECGMPNVLCLIPPNQYHNWYRSDSDIDYFMSSAGILPARNPRPWVKDYDYNFYPYGGYVDTTTGERIVDPVNMYVDEVWKRSVNQPELTLLPPKYKKVIDCHTNAAVMKRYKRVIPGCLKAFIKYTKLFTSDDVIYELKPIIYSYWS